MLEENSQNVSGAELRQKYVESMKNKLVFMKLSITKFSSNRTVKGAFKEDVARGANAEENSLTFSKRLLNRNLACVDRVMSMLNEVRSRWIGNSIPYVEKGIRLMHREAGEKYLEYISGMLTEFHAAVESMESNRDLILSDAAHRLGDLFDESDYSDKFTDRFSIYAQIDYRGPDQSLMLVDKETYQKQADYYQAAFDYTLYNAEKLLLQEFSTLLTGLSEKLQGAEEGNTKKLRANSITSCCNFFERFRRLNISSNPDFEEAINKAEAILGIDSDIARSLREDADLRSQVKGEIDNILDSVGKFVITVPVKGSQLFQPVQYDSGEGL